MIDGLLFDVTNSTVERRAGRARAAICDARRKYRRHYVRARNGTPPIMNITVLNENSSAFRRATLLENPEAGPSANSTSPYGRRARNADLTVAPRVRVRDHPGASGDAIEVFQ